MCCIDLCCVWLLCVLFVVFCRLALICVAFGCFVRCFLWFVVFLLCGFSSCVDLCIESICVAFRCFVLFAVVCRLALRLVALCVGRCDF